MLQEECLDHGEERNLDSDQINTIIIVGGGDNGLLTALALERRLEDAKIVVIDKFEESNPRVGKSTLTSFVQLFHGFLEIDHERLLSEVPLAFKTTVYFKDWCGIEPFHSPLGGALPIFAPKSREQSITPDPDSEFDELYYRYEECEYTEVYGELGEQPGKTPFVIGSGNSGLTVNKALPDVAYHFNTETFNKFLRSICQEREIELVNQRIQNVKTANDRIERLESESGQYVADLYIDASGFNQVLISNLNNSTVEFDIPVDSAVKASTGISPLDVESATVVTSGDAGWFWQIDTIECRDVGYVYSSDHITDQTAKQKLLEKLNEDLEDEQIHQLRWKPQMLDKAWVANCLAVGNAFAFTEPLHSFSLSTSMTLAFELANLISKHGGINHQGLRELYNKVARQKWNEVYKFQSILYKFNSGTTPFWEQARSIKSGQIEHVEEYKRSGFSAPSERARLTRTDTDQNRYMLYYLMLRNLGIDSQFFETIDYEVDQEVVQQIKNYNTEISNRLEKFLNYKEFYNMFQIDYRSLE